MSSALSNAELLTKFRGCMIGGLIGDCMGAPFEYKRNVTYAMLFDFFTDSLSGASEEEIKYTDDTCMSVSIAKSLVENGKVDVKDLAKKFVSDFFADEIDRNYGNNVCNVFKALRDSEYDDVFLPAKEQFDGGGSFGNGAAMRIAPVALFAIKETDDFLKDAVREVSFITHAHAFGYNGAILQCFAVRAALELDATKELDPVQFISNLEDKMNVIEPKDDVAPYLESLNKMKDIFLQKREDIVTGKEIARLLGNFVSAHKSVPAAIYSFLRGLKPLADFESDNPYVRTIFFAISLGRDTDTIAAMAGNISGAYYGIEKIPRVLKERCEKNKEIDELARELYRISQNES